MPKDLTAAEVSALSKDGTHRVARGLYLQVRGGNRSWLLRYRLRGKPMWMSLGPERLITLTDAKRRTLKAQRLLLDGIDPKQARDEERQISEMTFAQCADACIEALKPGWKNPDLHSRHWSSSLKNHAYPVIGDLPVDQITANHLVKILEPIWTTKTETAVKVRERIERILDWSTSAGHRSGPNPANWKTSLMHRLPSPSDVQEVEHRIAVPVADAPGVFAALVPKPQIAGKLLRIIMLTALRYNEAAGATWAEIDLDAAKWQVPASRMKTTSRNKKAKMPHEVPLSRQAVEILRDMRPADAKPDDLIFPGPSGDKPVTDTTVRKLLRGVGPADAHTHGLRSTFRDWVADRGLDGEAAEAALGHKLGNETTIAYLRSQLFERRVPLMQGWADYLTGEG